jgi:bacillithiol system protein YtxJ
VERFKAILNEADLDGVLRRGVAVLFKHSTTCPISTRAKEQVGEFMRQHPGVPVYLVDVLAQKPLSQQIAADLGIRHESPQAILLQRGKPLWHASHHEVTAAAISKRLPSP